MYLVKLQSTKRHYCEGHGVGIAARGFGGVGLLQERGLLGTHSTDHPSDVWGSGASSLGEMWENWSHRESPRPRPSAPGTGWSNANQTLHYFTQIHLRYL